MQLPKKLQTAIRLCLAEESKAIDKVAAMEGEIAKCNAEMISLREAIDEVAAGDGTPIIGQEDADIDPNKPRKWFYCSDCRVGGHGQRFCNYLLQRPNWRVYPCEKWFEDTNGQTSWCPLGKRGVDFTDETYFSRLAMHIKGRIWLEDKRKLYEFVPDIMPYTYVIANQHWVGEIPPPEGPEVPPMPWFIKETDRNWGTSIILCSRPQECLALVKPNATYVVQRHIENPLPYVNGEKCHIKFYTLMVGEADGVTWSLYTYKEGYICISPNPWSPTDLSKETQVTIIRTKRIGDWEYWPILYPKCREALRIVVQRAAEQGKLEGRPKKQFEIISADFVANTNLEVFMLEFNTGPVLRDPDYSKEVNDSGMILGALQIVEPWEHGDINNWDHVFSCKGVPPKPTDVNTPAT